MENDSIRFWEIKNLDEMSDREWDLLCDNCGRCCLEKIEDPDTGRIKMMPIACRFLDTFNCSCIIYENRLEIEPDCLRIYPQNIMDFTWLPETCAYRRIYEGKGLEWWHHLISGDPETVHEAEISVRGKALPYGYTFEDCS
ncbi:YcgN family cysteine cluster protein [Thermodesulfobacteriota bacterium]